MGLGLLHCQLVGLPPRPVTCGVRKEDTTGEPQQPKQSPGAASVWYTWGSPLSPVLLGIGTKWFRLQQGKGHHNIIWPDDTAFSSAQRYHEFALKL